MGLKTATSIGRKAEDMAAAYLVRQGYKIVQRNWRTRWCEIDIVAIKGRAVSLVEVKYRRSNSWGGGLEYVTPLKQKQMAFSAEFWMTVHDWSGPCYLAVVEVSGPKFEISEFIPEL